MRNPIIEMIKKRNNGIHTGLISFCTANRFVIEAIFLQAKRFDDDVLIEATANQVNQYGGYTGMQPEDFRDFVYEIADEMDFPKEKIILGGDHLGPLIWSGETERSAMEKSIELVKLFVRAGYKKIHLDTSMKLRDDSGECQLSDEVIAKRGAVLCEACEQEYRELKEKNPDELQPVYVIGSEVPIPGGAQEEESTVEVTRPEAVNQTLEVYRREFGKRNLAEAFEHVVGVVVQPGVEFGDADIFHYNRANASELCNEMKNHKNIVLEGHSTDYQSPNELRSMVEDGIAILKVGPALTFALRQGLFALSMMEKELVSQTDCADFIGVLEKIMLKNPANWEKHYHGTEEQIKQKRKYSFSDRCRYYLSHPEAEKAVNVLLRNMEGVQIPISMLQQYMPQQYEKVRDGKLPLRAKCLLLDNVVQLIETYNYAVKERIWVMT